MNETVATGGGAPSAVPHRTGIPRELTQDEIRWLVTRYAEAAERAKRAGYDGVELHGAHRYLIAEFLSPDTNKRQDEYGGDWSIAKYIEAVETKDEDKRRDIMNDILKYNEEDLMATWAVFEWLRRINLNS